ncbi:adenosylmethionine-8-amino-7-oxononanoate aminotransferase [Amycolatopsis bartoniae]|uniref:Aspartate aminotransferase family protein n=1 Tax=Amycolatopsis bartoniae TaxID=941986 RepID=A0A8H9IYR7_9PSEU|nr:aminotransferase class III-fold pyridoxal phosphate-dependent enzyme [Amycolatopsis bartoniae]MBB2934339.1 adenosylmethionine-8-amino-7-oxononanoate aminotransferase [Amycolatopsis bartoniae]TVT00184.1 aspartate aminotransferase family protein [Amycolatopsis bartoniae]GHF48067.1 aspartate aminotransferase family protein [Amycolatopsis bartoniae]
MGSALWHPFSDMAAVREDEFVLERGEDVWVYDTHGNRYLDATAALWYANVGHGRQEIADAAAGQLRTLAGYSIFGDFTNTPARDLANRLAGLAPMPDAKVFLTTGGGEAIDSAVKIARRYHDAQGEPGRVHVISRAQSYHGTNGVGTGVAGIEANRAGFGEFLPSSSRVPYDSVDALRDEILRVGPERVAAFLFEPVVGAGGVLPPPEGYVRGVIDVCHEFGVLAIADAVICGFGRLGTWFGVERWDAEPDLITFAKGVTSGYLPLGGVVAHGRVAEPFWERRGNTLRHGATYSGHPACCAAALANIAILDRERLVERGRIMETVLADALAPLARHPLVAEVRAGLGLLGAVELKAEVLETLPSAIADLALLVRQRGVLLRTLGKALAVSPPLTIQAEQLQEIGLALAVGLDELALKL